MLKKFFIGAAIGAVLLIAGLTAAAVYGLSSVGYYPAPQVSYADAGAERADLIVLADPDLAMERLMALTDFEQVIPGGLDLFVNNETLRTSIPDSVAVLGHHDADSQQYHLTFFLNERRFGPFITNRVNERLGELNMPRVQFAEEGMQLERRGFMRLNATVPVPQVTSNTVASEWGERPPHAPIVLEGGHLLECFADNTNGGIYTLWESLALSEEGTVSTPHRIGLDQIEVIDTLHLTANFTSTDEIAATLVLQCDNTLEEDRVASLKNPLELMLLEGARLRLKDQYDVDLTHTVTRTGWQITALMRFAGLEEILRQRLTQAGLTLRETP